MRPCRAAFEARLIGSRRRRSGSGRRAAEPGDRRQRLLRERRAAAEVSAGRCFAERGARRDATALVHQNEEKQDQCDHGRDGRVIRHDAERARPLDAGVSSRVRVAAEDYWREREADEQSDLNESAYPSTHRTHRSPPGPAEMSSGPPAANLSSRRSATASPAGSASAAAPASATDVAVFEAIHGDAPALVGKNAANPLPLLVAALLLLDHVGCAPTAARITAAIQAVLAEGRHLTADLGGNAGTREMTDAIVARLGAMR